MSKQETKNILPNHPLSLPDMQNSTSAEGITYATTKSSMVSAAKQSPTTKRRRRWNAPIPAFKRKKK